MEETKYKLSIKCWAEADRPREKLLLKGKHSLSDAELIAILLRSGSRDESAVELAKVILNRVNNDLNELGKLSVNDLMKTKGVGEAKAMCIVAALELDRRRRETDGIKKQKITSSRDVYDIFAPILSDLKHEEFWVLMLTRANKIINKKNISSGGMTGTVADAKIIFKSALEESACSIILCHNHPSGNTKPSDSDVSLTKKLKAAGEVMEVSVLDHVIIGDVGYYSFADEGMM